MAKKEGICTKCGSIIQIDESKDKVECIFCGETSDTKRALDLANDPTAASDLQKKALESSKSEKKQEAKTPAPQTKKKKTSTVKTEEVTTIKPLPQKTKTIIISVALAFFVIIAAIVYPIISIRNSRREAMDARLGEISIPVTDHTYHYNNNRAFWFVTDVEIDEDTAKTVFDEYANIYSQEHSVTMDEAKQMLSVKIFDPNGVHTTGYSNDTFVYEFETSDPTPTPEPTTAIE